MSPGPPAGSSCRWIRCRRPEPEKSHGDRLGQASDDAVHDQAPSRGGSGRAIRSRAWSRRGGATKVGVAIGRAADHLGRIEPLAAQRAERAAGLAGDHHAGGDVVRRLAQERAGLEPVGGHEDLLAAGAAQVAEPAGERPRYRWPAGRWCRRRRCPGRGTSRRRGPGAASRRSQAPCPLTAQYSSPSGGMAITPSTGSPSSIRPMLMAQSGSPWTRLPVPSIGSIDHRRGPEPPSAAYSSPVSRSSGNRSPSRPRISCSRS